MSILKITRTMAFIQGDHTFDDNLRKCLSMLSTNVGANLPSYIIGRIHIKLIVANCDVMNRSKTFKFQFVRVYSVQQKLAINSHIQIHISYIIKTYQIFHRTSLRNYIVPI